MNTLQSPEDLKNYSPQQQHDKIMERLRNSNRTPAESTFLQTQHILATNSTVLNDLRKQVSDLTAAGKSVPAGLKDAAISTANFDQIIRDMSGEKNLRAEDLISRKSTLQEIHTRLMEKYNIDSNTAANQMKLAFYQLAKAKQKIENISNDVIRYAGGNPDYPAILAKNHRGQEVNLMSDDLNRYLDLGKSSWSNFINNKPGEAFQSFP